MNRRNGLLAFVWFFFAGSTIRSSDCSDWFSAWVCAFVNIFSQQCLVDTLRRILLHHKLRYSNLYWTVSLDLSQFYLFVATWPLTSPAKMRGIDLPQSSRRMRMPYALMSEMAWGLISRESVSIFAQFILEASSLSLFLIIHFDHLLLV